LSAPNERLLSEGRFFIAWMLLPLIALGVNNERWLHWLWRATLGIAVVMAIYVCVQTFGGVQILTSARDLALSTTSAEGGAGIIRSAVGGATYIMVLALLLAINRVIERRWWIVAATPLALLMLAALAASFGRAVWVATLCGLFVSSLVFRGIKSALISMLLMAVLISAMVGAVMVASPRTGQAMVDRVTRLGDEIERGGSFQWRLQENRDAADSIARRPLFGVGIGGDYKNINLSHGLFAVETTYIHHAYLYFPVKMGLHASLIPLFFIVAMVIAVRRALAIRPALDRARIAALAGTFTVLCVASLNQPEWTSLGGIAAFCVVMGLIALEQRFGTGAEAAAQQAEKRR
jgi:O-antigen ligase